VASGFGAAGKLSLVITLGDLGVDFFCSWAWRAASATEVSCESCAANCVASKAERDKANGRVSAMTLWRIATPSSFR